MTTLKTAKRYSFKQFNIDHPGFIWIRDPTKFSYVREGKYLAQRRYKSLPVKRTALLIGRSNGGSFLYTEKLIGYGFEKGSQGIGKEKSWNGIFFTFRDYDLGGIMEKYARYGTDFKKAGIIPSEAVIFEE